ncbi:MAG: septum formation protein Maf, partial [Pseudobutyrivibrio sp.]|nr:septum formation protein Maf [Pseudobutyrivibrio sp.]
MNIILASNSPRRKELLEQAGIDFEVKAADVEEITTKTKPNEVVEELSLIKSKAIAANNPNRIVLAADTVVACDGKILGKPKDEADALRMLKALSGKCHEVYTGVTIIDEHGEANTFSECTEVVMYESSDELLR